MGYGDYSHEAHEALIRGRAALPRQQVFQQTSCHALMNPKGVRYRESRDSAEHPNSLPIAFALDVTGSMGDIPDLLARRELPKFMKLLMDCQVQDPQLLFLAVGDATCDQASLQVGQFESRADLMDQWLTWTFLEGGGGGQNTESYELALYFLAEHTDTDAFFKRKTRGYVFMTGDELPYPAVSRHQVEALIGDQLDEDIPTETVVAAVAETYRPFFLIPDLERRKRCEARWRELLGDHVVCMENPADTCPVSAGIVALTEGAVTDLDALAKRLEAAGTPRDRLGAVVRALMPYAGTLDREGGTQPKLGHAALGGDGPSFWKRLFKR
jgi:hypothetical protein